LKSIQDTIVAPATPNGESALAVIRISGPMCRDLIAQALRCMKPVPRRATLGNWRAQDGRLLDEVLWVYFPSPHSYTGDDVLEISIHGNPYIMEQLLQDLILRGTRLADPGEFTRRAYLNRKMDLSQAEAVADWIHARTDAALQAARAQREGAISREMALRCEELLEVIAWLEAYIDFPEEDLPDPDFSQPLSQLNQLLQRLQRLLESEERGRFLREGISVVLIGEPNVGKSSLLNALLRQERVLVSATPGTTRDYITEDLRIGDYRIRITDTAGLRGDSDDPLEKLGMEASLRQVESADLILWVVDGSKERSVDWIKIRALLPENRWIQLLNKSDLGLHQIWQEQDPLPCPRVVLSVRDGCGIAELETEILRWIEERLPLPLPEQILLNARHAHALRSACAHLQICMDRLRSGHGIELVAEDLRETLRFFEEVVGIVDNERMLDKLFANFCIGK
jgi:tRNA modification GTPase